MNKTIGVFIVFLTFIIQIHAQSLTENEIIGKWTVSQINVLMKLPDDQKKMIEIMKEAILRSKLEFKSDNTFEFEFELEKMRIQNGHWKYNDITKSFIIQAWDNKDTNDWKLMEIFTRREGNKIIFQIRELFVDLVMNKEF